MNNKKRYVYMDYLRVLAILGVVMIHVSGLKWSELEIGSWDFNVHTMYNLVGRYSVCVFCMISGALFLRPEKDITIRVIVTKYIKRILICFFVWLFLYAILFTVMDKGDFSYFIENLFELPMHMWYLLMIIGLYLVLPILRLIAKDKKITLYMIWLLIAFAFFFRTFSGIRNLFPENWVDSLGFRIVDNLIINVNYMNVSFVPGYLGLFMLGHYIHEYGVGKWHKALTISVIPALVLSGILTIVVSSWREMYVTLFMLESNLLIILASAGMFEFFKNSKTGDRVYDPDVGLNKAVSIVADHAFGIYLVHYGLNKVLNHYFELNSLSFEPLIAIPVIVLLVAIVSFLIVAVLKKIPFVRIIVS